MNELKTERTAKKHEKKRKTKCKTWTKEVGQESNNNKIMKYELRNRCDLIYCKWRYAACEI